jgi:hypothetical protein
MALVFVIALRKALLDVLPIVLLDIYVPFAG